MDNNRGINRMPVVNVGPVGAMPGRAAFAALPANAVIRTANYPNEIDLSVSFKNGTFHPKTQTIGDEIWDVSTRLIDHDEDLRKLQVTVRLMPVDNRVVAATIKLFCSPTSPPPRVPAVLVNFVFDKDHPTAIFNDAFMVPKLSPEHMRFISPESIYIKVRIEKIEIKSEFTYHNQKWPGGKEWHHNKKDKTIAVNLNGSELEKMHSNYHHLKSRLVQGLLTEREDIAYFNFAAAITHKAFINSEKFHDVLRDGFKLGFTKGWEHWDRKGVGLPFMIRTLLPSYPKIAYIEENTRNTLDERQKNFLRKFPLTLDPEDPRRSFSIHEFVHTHPINGEISFWLEKTYDGLPILMAGAIYEISENVRYELSATIDIMVSQVSHMRARGKRLIHKDQNTFGIYIGVLSDEMMNLLRTGGLTANVLFSHEPTTRTAQLDTEFEIITRDRHCIQTILAMPGPCNDVTYMQAVKEARTQGLEDPTPHPTWVNQPSGFLKCKDGEMIGVAKEYLAAHCEYFRQKFYDGSFNDCGKDTVEVDQDSDVVMDVLNILWHRCHVVNPDNVQAILFLTNPWLCPPIWKYLEVAIIKTDAIENWEKQLMASNCHFDIINYIFRNHDLATEFDIILPKRHVQVLVNANDADLDVDRNGVKPQKTKRKGDETSKETKKQNRGKTDSSSSSSKSSSSSSSSSD